VSRLGTRGGFGHVEGINHDDDDDDDDGVHKLRSILWTGQYRYGILPAV
jgi:hypothetical protein